MYLHYTSYQERKKTIQLKKYNQKRKNRSNNKNKIENFSTRTNKIIIMNNIFHVIR